VEAVQYCLAAVNQPMVQLRLAIQKSRDKVSVTLAMTETEEANMPEVKYRQHHSGSTPEERISSRLRNSGDVANADHVVQKGDSPLRTFTNIYHGGSAKQHGGDAKGFGIDGRERGPADRERHD
jgi:hypothetical protein